MAAKLMIRAKRVYDPAANDDGARFLVERLWPRGMRKEDLRMDGWLKDVAPSQTLRKWYAHDVAKWAEFQKRYRKELAANPEALAPLLLAAKKGNVTLLYAAHDAEHNSAILLRDVLQEHLQG